MGLFGLSISKTKKIQAMGLSEGEKQTLTIESLLSGSPISADGCGNNYTTHASQTSAIYRKYKGKDTLGNWQLRAVIDTRTSFISGEGISVQARKQATADWIERFIKINHLDGTRFFDWVKSGEMNGSALVIVKENKKKNAVLAARVPNTFENGPGYECRYNDPYFPEDSIEIYQGEKKMPEKNFRYIKLAGVPGDLTSTETKAGLVLNEIDNYDRAMNGMRYNNHLFGRSTPFFECEDDNTVAKIAEIIKKGWKFGSAIAAKAKMSMVGPDPKAMESLKAEQAARTKSISFTTGIPVHWAGHVDMMSNRSVSDSLYETISNATINERTAWAEALYDIILMGMKQAVDAGHDDAPNLVDTNFSVVIPLIPFTKMLDYVKTLSLAFSDGALSMQSYENMLPGINPLVERKNKKAEAAAVAKATDNLISKTEIPKIEDTENEQN